MRTFMAVPWLRLSASTAGGLGLIPGGGSTILQASWKGKTMIYYFYYQGFEIINPR